MDDNLVGYLLHALDPEMQRHTERYLERRPEARQRLERLRRSLEPLALDSTPVEPPKDLVVRALAHVAEYCCRDLPPAPPQPYARTLALPRFSIRRMDVLVAACLLLLVGGIGTSWLYYLHFLHGRSTCEQDLHEMYVGLDAYRMQKGAFPDVNKIAKPPKNVAGLVVPMLVSEGYLAKDFAIHCPGEQALGFPVDFKTALAMDVEDFNYHAPTFTPCYGYSLGYKDSSGNVHGPSAAAGDVSSSILMLMADTPPPESSLANSPNHGGFGQNVLFQDGSCRFVRDRNAGIGGDDMYLNKDNKRKAGTDPLDPVIGDSASQP